MLRCFFERFTCASLLVLFISAHLASTTHAPLFPTLHSHLSRPAERLSHRAHIRSLQAVRSPPSDVLEAREQEHKVGVVRWLKRLNAELVREGEEVGKMAEKVRKSLGGVVREEEQHEMGVALHDALFALVQLVVASNEHSVLPSPVRLAEDFARARPAAASASHVPSGRATHQKRNMDSPPADPQDALHSTLSLLTRHLAPAVEVLPHLPLVQRESIRSLCEELQDEVELLVEVVEEGSGNRSKTTKGGKDKVVETWLARSAARLWSVAVNTSSPVVPSSVSSYDYEAQLNVYRKDFETEQDDQVRLRQA